MYILPSQAVMNKKAVRHTRRFPHDPIKKTTDDQLVKDIPWRFEFLMHQRDDVKGKKLLDSLNVNKLPTGRVRNFITVPRQYTVAPSSGIRLSGCCLTAVEASRTRHYRCSHLRLSPWHQLSTHWHRPPQPSAW